MRKSLEDNFKFWVVPNVECPYIVPDELRGHHCFLFDGGHVIMCIPQKFREESAKNPDDYEIGVSMTYVLSHPYEIVGDYVYIDVPVREDGREDITDYPDYYGAEIGKEFYYLDPHEEGVSFKTNLGDCLLIYSIPNPTPKQIAAIGCNESFDIKILPINDIVWIMSKCGDMDWMATPYTPYLSKGIATAVKSNALIVIMTDSNDLILKNSRIAGMSDSFLSILNDYNARKRNEWIENLPTAFNKDAFLAEVNRVRTEYTVQDLVRIADEYSK